jgi:hypothetical protein
MTESEWLACTNEGKLLHYLDKQISERRQRLFNVACCRQIWHLLSDGRTRRAVEVAERFADGLATSEELAAVQRDALRAAHELVRAEANAAHTTAAEQFWSVASEVVWALVRSRVEDVSTQISEREAATGTAHGELATLLRDLVGNPFNPVAVATAWRTPCVTAIAKAIYEEQRFEDLPILADALEDAGCTESSVLEHLRGNGPHVRGCWVLDLLLDKK